MMRFETTLPLPFPKEVLGMVYSFDSTHRDDYVRVMNELTLRFNQGLWWLYAVDKLGEYTPEMEVDAETDVFEWYAWEAEAKGEEPDGGELEWNQVERDTGFNMEGCDRVGFNDFDAKDDICMQALHHISLMDEITAFTMLVYS